MTAGKGMIFMVARFGGHIQCQVEQFILLAQSIWVEACYRMDIVFSMEKEHCESFEGNAGTILYMNETDKLSPLMNNK